MIATYTAAPARAAFTTVINSPPDALAKPFNFFQLASNTQLNLFAGAELYEGCCWPGDDWEPRDNIELNLEGGTIHGTLATGIAGVEHTNVVFNIRSGTVDQSVDVTNGNEINVSGGTIGHPYSGDIRLAGGSRANITGGLVANILDLNNASTAAVSGGVIGQGITVRTGSHLAISGGQVGDDYHFSGGIGVQSGSTVTMTGGKTDGFWLSEGSSATISGGSVTQELYLETGSSVQVSGGRFGRMSAYAEGRIELIGANFRVNGSPVAGLATPGSQVAVNLPESAVLTGVLADGSALVLTQQGYNDWLPDGTLRLTSAAIPAVAPGVIHAPGAAIPHSLRSGQRLELNDGAITPTNLRATWGSTIHINGGEIGPRLRAAGAVVDLNAGRLGEQALVTTGSVLNVAGGTVESGLGAASGSTVNLSGGIVEEQFHALPGSNVNLTGGVLRPSFHVQEGSHVTIAGSGFRINGLPVSGLTAAGATRPVDIPAGAVLSGTYANGRPFAFANGTSDFLAPGTITLKAAPAPQSGPTIVSVPTDAAPVGLRTGQLLYLNNGGDLGDDFNADWGSVVTIEGGRVGTHFETVGTLVNVTGGTIGHYFSALYGSVVNVADGTFEGYVDIENGAAFNFAGGKVQGGLAVLSGASAQISGGNIDNDVFAGQGGVIKITGGRIAGNAHIYGTSSLNVSGGQISSEVFVIGGGVANLSGGTFGDGLHVFDNSRLQITGKDFRIDGALIEGLPEYGPWTSIAIPQGSVFSGVFQDGTPFAFSDADIGYASYGDQLEPGSVSVVRDYYAPPAVAPLVDYAGFLAPAGAREGQAVVVDAQQSLGDNFVAGWGSAVTMTAGAVGRNFEAVGAQVLIAGGTVGPEFDAFHGSEVTITGGVFGEGFTAHAGSVANIAGGRFERGITVGPGSDVNITGGDFGFSSIAAGPDSTIHITGSHFFIDGLPIPGLALGQTKTYYVSSNSSLSGLLADGMPMDVRFEGYFRPDMPPAPASTVILTLVPDSDLDRDGVVSSSDLAHWQNSFGRDSYGDADSDLDSDGADFLIWQRQLGTRRRVFDDPVAVPEPASALLVGLISLSGLLVARSRRLS